MERIQLVLHLGLLVLLSGCAANSPKPASPPLPQAASAKDVTGALPFTIHDNRLLVDVFLNGQGPFVMIFDAAGPSTMTPEVQKALDLRSQGFEFSLDGESVSNAPVVHVNSVRAGDFQLNEQTFQVVNLAPIRRAFRFPHLDGIIGLEFVKQSRLRLDFDKDRIERIADAAPAPAGAVPFEVKDGRPMIDGKINGQPAKILIDTSDRSNLTLFRKFAADSQLEDLFSHHEKMVTGMGLNGPIHGQLASMQTVDLGVNEVSDVITRLPLTTSGYFFTPDISASAGIGMLKNYNIEFDYKKQVVALQRRKNFQESSSFVPINPVR